MVNYKSQCHLALTTHFFFCWQFVFVWVQCRLLAARLCFPESFRSVGGLLTRQEVPSLKHLSVLEGRGWGTMGRGVALSSVAYFALWGVKQLCHDDFGREIRHILMQYKRLPKSLGFLSASFRTSTDFPLTKTVLRVFVSVWSFYDALPSWLQSILKFSLMPLDDMHNLYKFRKYQLGLSLTKDWFLFL